MQISLRSQMIAGTTAFVGAAAIAMTPVAPAVSIPSISTAKANVALASLNNPAGALLNTALVLGNYFLNGAYTTADVNWPGSGTNDYQAGIGAIINAGLPLQGVTKPGLLPNIIDTPFPVLTTLATNWVGYAYIGGSSLLSAAGDVSDIVWTIPATAVQVLVDLVTNPAQIVPDIQSAIQAILFSAQEAVNTLIGGATTIVSSIVTKAQAVVQFLLEEAGQLATIIPAQVGLVVNAVSGLVSNVVAGFSTANPIEGVWNALVDGLLDASVSGSIPATVINLTAGAGIQVAPVTGVPLPFAPSVRTTGTILLNGVADALNTPVPSAASARKAAAAPAAAAAVEAAPAADTTAGDNGSADDATTAAPAASAVAADDSTSSDAPKASKAGAARAGR